MWKNVKTLLPKLKGKNKNCQNGQTVIPIGNPTREKQIPTHWSPTGWK
jgi:hypothetical protein